MRLLLACALLLAACQVDRRSDGYRCERTDDCTDGRTCEDGWCVGEDPPDAAPFDAEAPCPAACTACIAGRCEIDCTQAGTCSDEVVCPAGLPCDVTCSGFGSCGGGVDCTAASSCTITCSANGSCDGPLACGDGACTVDCSADNTCGQGIDCDASCACDVGCAGTDSCATPASCPGPGQCDTGRGCTSGPGPCSACPDS